MTNVKYFENYLAYKNAEQPIMGAPIVDIGKGNTCIPQHFLKYEHTLESIESVIADISFSDKYPIFACEDQTGLYLVIGIIGRDNYKTHLTDTPLKIVYGRKWRVEPNLPSSEIIQTAFLAIKKAREHEIRELFRLKSYDSYKSSTPFSGHHDTPVLERLMNKTDRINKPSSLDNIREMLLRITFDNNNIILEDIETLKSGAHALSLTIKENGNKFHNTDIPEYKNLTLNIIVDVLDTNLITFSIMQELIKISDRYVDEKFQYRGFHRFSWTNYISEIGDISIMLRDKQRITETPNFEGHFENMNYDVDSTRVPVLKDGILSQIILNKLASFGELEGHLPIKA